MWTILLGPLLAFLPRPWRNWVPISGVIQGVREAILRGFVEFVAGIIALSYWYMYAMTAWVDHAVDSALDGKMGPGITTHQIAGVALAVWAIHPLTWFFGYFMFEGSVRLAGAVSSGSVFGTLPLFRLAKLLFGPFRRRRADSFDPTHNFSGNASSF